MLTAMTSRAFTFVFSTAVALTSWSASFPEFKAHRIDNWGSSIGQTALADLDRDGDLDWIAGNANYAGTVGSEICWWEFQAPDRWVRHDLGKGNTDVGGAAFDVDGDRDLDVYSGAGPLSAANRFACYIWENAGGGKRWIEHELLTGKQCHEAEAGDVDGDGDIDICTKPWSGTNEHLFLENRLKTAPGGTTR